MGRQNASCCSTQRWLLLMVFFDLILFSHLQKEKLSIQLVSLILCIYMWRVSWGWFQFESTTLSSNPTRRSFTETTRLTTVLFLCSVTALSSRPDASFLTWLHVLFLQHWCCRGKCLLGRLHIYSFPGTLNRNALYSFFPKMNSDASLILHGYGFLGSQRSRSQVQPLDRFGLASILF